MTEEELIGKLEMIQRMKSESNILELKSAEKGCPQHLYDSLSSFSNQDEGGIIIFGINEKQDYKEVGVYDPQDIQKKINEQCLQMEPIVRPLLTVAQNEKELENIMAATAYVYALIGAKEYEAAEKLIHQFIIDESECLEENEIMFRAASKYYGTIGDKTKKKQLDKVLKEYEAYVDRMIEEEWLGSDEDDWIEAEELPFD